MQNLKEYVHTYYERNKKTLFNVQIKEQNNFESFRHMYGCHTILFLN